MTDQTTVRATGGITITLPGGNAHEVGSFELDLPIVVTVTDGAAEGILDQDAFREILAAALEATATELRAGA